MVDRKPDKFEVVGSLPTRPTCLPARAGEVPRATAAEHRPGTALRPGRSGELSGFEFLIYIL